ncbi:MAG: 5'-nucleotidase C-terminal domain-containing protein, partial [Sphaerochaetaceae bacterium]|nr:5'-nucleotidase C-terminal domain-containing protein [Sphaerochaetaceae bacterium]
AASDLAKMFGVGFVPADKEAQAYIDYAKAQLDKVLKAEKAAAEKAAAERAVKLAAEKAAAEKAAAAKAAADAAAKKAAEAAKPVVVAEVAKPAVDADVIVKSDDGQKSFNFYIVHTNDVHGRIEEGDGVGYAKLATLVKMGRSVTNKNLLLDAGDVTHGTTLTNLFNGETVGVLLDMLGYDAVVPGNHDFNYGKDRLIEAAKIAEMYSNLRVLAANVLDETGKQVFQPYQLYSYDGFVVGVIGASTPDTATKTHPKNIQGLSFMSDEVVYGAQALVDEVDKRSDYVIVLAHLGLDEDGSVGITSKMIAENIDGIDLIVDGHSHTVLENGMKVEDTWIVSAGEYMKYVGVVELKVEDKKVTNVYPFLVSAAEVKDPSTSELAKFVGITEVEPDAEVQAYIDAQKKELAKITEQVVAYTPVRLEGERADVRTRPTNLGTMIATAMKDSTGADVALTNGGGVRASIDVGDITRGEIITVLPFNNTVVLVEVTGQDIYDALEFGYSQLPNQNGGFPQTAGMQIVYSRFSAVGNRIKRVLINGKEVDRKATYKLATNDFMAAGGDGYTMLDRPVLMYGKGLDEVLTEYLVQHFKK